MNDQEAVAAKLGRVLLLPHAPTSLASSVSFIMTKRTGLFPSELNCARYSFQRSTPAAR